MIALAVSVCLNIVLFCFLFDAYLKLDLERLRVKNRTRDYETWRKLADDWRDISDRWKAHALDAMVRSRCSGAPITWTVDAIRKVDN